MQIRYFEQEFALMKILIQSLPARLKKMIEKIIEVYKVYDINILIYKEKSFIYVMKCWWNMTCNDIRK